jgi:arabinofuranan 3-O-arabinosyltransferase
MRSGASLRIAVCAGSVLVTVVFAALRVRSAVHAAGAGFDFLPVYDAGVAVVNGQGHSIYAIDPANPFVYPPTCALIAALVAKLMSLSSAEWLMASAEFFSIVITSYAALRLTLHSRWWPVVASVWLIVLMATNFTMSSAELENLSILLPPAALLVYYFAATDRWELAMVVLGSAILVKPLLAPLFLLPLLAQKFRLTAITVVVIVAVALLAALVTGSAGHLPSLVHRLAAGSNLSGRYASVDNSSLYGLGEHHGVSALTDLLRVLVVLLFVAVVWRTRRRPDIWGLQEYAGVGTLALLATFLAGSLSEIHYLFSIIPGTIIVLVLTKSRAARTCLILGAVFALVPAQRVFHHDGADWEQLQLVVAQIMLFAGIWIDLALDASAASLRISAASGLRSRRLFRVA